MPYLEVRNMSASLGKNIILKNISFSVNKGEIVGLLGRNGSGKTTIIKVLAGLIKPQKGSVTINGGVIDYSFYNRFIGYCPQENSFFEKLTVKENIEYFGHLYNIDKHELSVRTDKIAYLLDLEEKLDKLAGTLSGGQKRRINIACSIVNQPQILLMDEPSLAVDPISKINLWKLIKTINKTGTTIIVSSNSLEELKQLCDVIVAIKSGAVVFQGPASAIQDGSALRNLLIREGDRYASD